MSGQERSAAQPATVSPKNPVTVKTGDTVAGSWYVEYRFVPGCLQIEMNHAELACVI